MPHRSLCRCGTEVVEIPPYVLDATELVPRHRCKRCGGRGIEAWDTGRGRKSAPCAKCNGEMFLGEPVLPGLIAVDASDKPRLLRAPILREGEALHRVHVCDFTMNDERAEALLGRTVAV